MKELNKQEMLQIDGGTTLNSTVMSTLLKSASVFLEIGRSLGTAIRRAVSSCVC